MKDKFLHTNSRPKVRTKTMEIYYKLGRKARDGGAEKKDNPYRQPNFFRSWRAGWEDSDSEIG
tara:strand:- start:204 stop:392 length:189 start_codon:yes stop_codon:yes gene_type:complete